jgi:hypothetical protein
MRHIVEDDHDQEDDTDSSSLSSLSVWVAWIDSDGHCHAFRRLPCRNRHTINADDEFTVTVRDKHIERSFLGHAFLFVVRANEDEEEEEGDDSPKQMESQNNTATMVQSWNASSLDLRTIVGAYRPERLSTNSAIRPDDLPCHIVEVIQNRPRRNFFLHRCPCHPPIMGTPSFQDTNFAVKVREAQCLEPLTTTNKDYVEERIHRWPICVERDCFVNHTDFRKVFQKDLSYALSCFTGLCPQIVT